MSSRVGRADDQVFELAEGPVWDPRRHRLLWVDIVGGAVLEGALERERVTVTGRHDLDESVGAVAVADDGTLLVAGREDLVAIGPDGHRTRGPRLVPAGSGRRLNDGCPDPAGRFVVGTLAIAGSSRAESLVRVDRDRSVTTIDDDLTLSNGLAWSADGTRMFSVDSERHVIFEREYDPSTGDVGERRTFAEVTDGFPDGIALDAGGRLWVAVWGAGEVRCLAADGQVVERVAVPAPHTSCVAFAGDDLRTLVITTARDGLSPDLLAAHPGSGALYTMRVDVPGLPVAAWSGFADGP